MKRIAIFAAGITLAFLLCGCFAFLPQSDGYLSMDLRIPPELKGPGDHPVVIFVANADMEDSIKELLWLIDKVSEGFASSKEEDRLVDLAVAVSNRGLVKFGGDPFLRTTIPALSPLAANTGSFEIPGIPAGRSYFVKVFVFETGQEIVNVDELSEVVLELESQLFDTEDWSVPINAWDPFAPFPIKVEAGKTTKIDIALVSEL